MMATKQVIHIEEISIIAIPLVDSNNNELHNIVLALECNSNLILLGQL